MSVMVILVGFSILVAAGFLLAFLWAVKSGQYDDRHTPAVRMLFDDKKPGLKKLNKKSESESGDLNRLKTTDQPPQNGVTDPDAEVNREAEQRYGS